MLRRLLLSAALLSATTAWAGELKVVRGDDPLRTDINEAEDSVRLVFLGAPT